MSKKRAKNPVTFTQSPPKPPVTWVTIRSNDDLGTAYHLSVQAIEALGELHLTGLYGSGNVADVALQLLMRAIREEVTANRRAARGPAVVRGR